MSETDEFFNLADSLRKDSTRDITDIKEEGFISALDVLNSMMGPR